MATVPERESGDLNLGKVNQAIEAAKTGSFAIIDALSGVSGQTIFQESVEIDSAYQQLLQPPRREAEPVDELLSELTQREREIIELLAEGHSNHELAAMLWITEQTVKFHLSHIYSKLNVKNRTEAAHFFHKANGQSGEAQRVVRIGEAIETTIPLVDKDGEPVEDPQVRNLRLAGAFMEASQQLLRKIADSSDDGTK